MSSTRRHSILIDREVQGALILRVIIYWFYCLLSVTLMVFCWAVFRGPPRPLDQIVGDLLANYLPALAASLLLLPIVMVDVVRFSNAFVGPMFRLKGHMRRLAEGEQVPDLRIRKNDYWYDLAASFNALLLKVQPVTDEQSTLDSEAEVCAEKTVSYVAQNVET